ncbi:MAG: AgmX/PglI C-terminal domain-containing protein [Woeseiaceae bacterium]|nr:AgmX/PglI C-terminal domain-containing protein [Woeseiaceae bacterium]
MSTDELNQQKREVHAQVEQSEIALEQLEAELTAVIGELNSLAEKRPQYDALAAVCDSLEALESTGAEHLFWGDSDDAEIATARIESARLRIDKYAGEIQLIEERRQVVQDSIDERNDELDALHYDLQDIIEQEEAIQNEWLVERDLDDVPERAIVMPWARGQEEDARYRKSLGLSMAASLALALIVGSIAIPIKERDPIEELPDRVAKLVREERTPPPPVEPEPVIPDEAIPEPEPELVEEVPPEPSPEILEETAVAAESKPVNTTEQVKSKGILAFRESFAEKANLRPSAKLGSQARISSAGSDSVGRPERAMVTTSAAGSSGGINLASISRDVGGGGGEIGGVAVSRVESSIGGSGGPDRPLSAGAFAGRTDEEIQIVFDRYKAALYRLYNRELRKDPTLRGQMVLKLTIEPDGSVSMCELQASDLDAPTLAGQVVERVRTFDFGAKEDIVAVTIVYPIDFLPAA